MGPGQRPGRAAGDPAIKDYYVLLKTKMEYFSEYQHEFTEEEWNILKTHINNSLLSHEDFQQILDEKSDKLYEMFSDITESLTYRKDKKIHRTSLHIGQRKLFLTQLFFLNEYLETPFTEAIVIYAGAAPSNTMYLLGKMFPCVKFVLIDPNPFHLFKNKKGVDLKIINYDNLKHIIPKKLIISKDGSWAVPYNEYFRSNTDHPPKTILNNNVIVKLQTITADIINNTNEQFFIYQDYFTIDICKELRKLEKIFFWSDIRTDSNGDSIEITDPDDFHIIWNSAQQYIWMRMLQPEQSMLKFRAPFDFDEKTYNKLKTDSHQPMKDIKLAKKEGLDFLTNYKNQEFHFYKGKILLQCWSRRSSTESRLIVSRNTIIHDRIKKYDWHEYEDKFCYLNNVVRTFKYYTNEHTNAKIGFDNCFDCTREAQIMEGYDNPVANVEKIRKDLNAIIPRNLFADGHGKLNSQNNIILKYLKFILHKQQYDPINDILKKSQKKYAGNTNHAYFMKQQYDPINDILKKSQKKYAGNTNHAYFMKQQVNYPKSTHTFDGRLLFYVNKTTPLNM
jgi:hypothetical protein